MFIQGWNRTLDKTISHKRRLVTGKFHETWQEVDLEEALTSDLHGFDTEINVSFSMSSHILFCEISYYLFNGSFALGGAREVIDY